tara:strand:- start:3605 stop:5227 length:1623 start_codon:yes stop_codon:yes gene_type:complete
MTDSLGNPNVAIVGYTGFVGSNILQFYKVTHFYNSKNFHEAKGMNFDVVIFCGAPATKWIANKYPEQDCEVIDSIINTLHTMKVERFILISTIDVYDKIDTRNNELYELNGEDNHTYGKNRLKLEKFVQSYSGFVTTHIVRLPALFGKGLKKNIIYDLIHNNNVNDIPIDSEFQWYDLEWLKDDIDTIIKKNIAVCNLFTPPLHTKKIIEIFKKVYNIDYGFQTEYSCNDIVKRRYDVATVNGLSFNGDEHYIRNTGEVEKSIERYLEFTRINTDKLCVSNVCLNKVSHEQLISLLKLNGISNIQVAPTKLMNGVWDLSNLDLTRFKEKNIRVYAFQSILYGLNDLNIFDLNTRNEMIDHMKMIIDYAEKNEVKVLVFGCPRNRKIIDEREDNDEIFVSFFKEIGDYMKGKSVVICIENNSKQYNCNYINRVDECALLVRKIGRENIKMMIDIGNCLMEQDLKYNLLPYKDILFNIDVSKPNMSGLNVIGEEEHIFSYLLQRMEYQYVINLEMLSMNSNDEIDCIRKSLDNFIRVFGKRE